MRIVTDTLSIEELHEMSLRMFGNFVKGVVDVDRSILVVDADLHADEESMLLERGSKQESLWGINLYPELFGSPQFIEFDSMINLRPSQGNKSRSVDDKQIRERIVDIVLKYIRV